MSFRNFLKRRRPINESDFQIGSLTYKLEPSSSVNNSGYHLESSDGNVIIDISKTLGKPQIKIYDFEKLFENGDDIMLREFFKKHYKDGKYNIDAILSIFDNEMPEVCRTTYKVNVRRARN